MKEKTRIFIFAFVLISVVALLTTMVVAASRDISDVIGRSYTKIGDEYEFDLQTLVGNKNAYCTQHGKRMRTNDFAKYTLAKYIEIDGKEATVYTNRNGASKTYANDKNAQMAYILNQEQGYGTETWNGDKGTITNTEGQNALWHIFNSWADGLEMSDYKQSKNDKIGNQTMNTNAENYANTVGNVKTSDKSAGSTLKVTGATNKNGITVIE